MGNSTPVTVRGNFGNILNAEVIRIIIEALKTSKLGDRKRSSLGRNLEP